MTPQPPAKGHLRLGNLDYLRGISALCIMIYHYATWHLGEQSAQSFLGRMGIYGVAIFYILSGLTLTYAYQTWLFLSLKELKKFFKKRIFRIFPLLWLATLFSILLSKKIPVFTDVLLNLSGLFGFVKWDTYFATGAWSIGNELVFYSIFPLLLIALRKNQYIPYLLTSIILACHLFFAFRAIDTNKDLSAQWHLYTNPLNQIAFFYSGILLFTTFHNKLLGNGLCTCLIIVGICALALYPSNFTSTDLVVKTNRIVFTGSCILICLGFYKSQILLPNVIHRFLTFLGKTSYSIYLLHPIVYAIVKVIFKVFDEQLRELPEVLMTTTAIIATLCVSHFTHKYFEIPLINLGNTEKLSTN